MAIELVVVHPFAEYQTGDRITDPDTVTAILAGEQAGRVVAVAVDEQPAPKPKKASNT